MFFNCSVFFSNCEIGDGKLRKIRFRETNTRDPDTFSPFFCFWAFLSDTVAYVCTEIGKGVDHNNFRFWIGFQMFIENLYFGHLPNCGQSFMIFCRIVAEFFPHFISYLNYILSSLQCYYIFTEFTASYLCRSLAITTKQLLQNATVSSLMLHCETWRFYCTSYWTSLHCLPSIVFILSQSNQIRAS